MISESSIEMRQSSVHPENFPTKLYIGRRCKNKTLILRYRWLFIFIPFDLFHKRMSWTLTVLVCAKSLKCGKMVFQTGISFEKHEYHQEEAIRGTHSIDDQPWTEYYRAHRRGYWSISGTSRRTQRGLYLQIQSVRSILISAAWFPQIDDTAMEARKRRDSELAEFRGIHVILLAF